MRLERNTREMTVGDEGPEGIKERKNWRGIKIRRKCIYPGHCQGHLQGDKLGTSPTP
jgi:hypothetical protein